MAGALLSEPSETGQSRLSNERHSADSPVAGCPARDRIRASLVAGRGGTIPRRLDFPVRRSCLRKEGAGVFLGLAFFAGGNALVGGEGAGAGVRRLRAALAVDFLLGRGSSPLLHPW